MNGSPTALIVVDMQNDFAIVGDLYVPGAEQVFAPLNAAIERARSAGVLVVYTQDWHPPSTRGVGEVVLGGLAPDYCVKETALDALRRGFRTTVLVDATRPVELQTGDGERALSELQRNGARLATVTSAPL